MDVTEAPPQQDPDGLLAKGWAAPVSLAPDALDAAQCLIVAQRNVIHERNETVARLGYDLVTAESERDAAVRERDEALAAAHRYETASIRLSVDNRALRERVAALQRANEGSRRQAAADRAWRALGRIRAVLAAGPGAAPVWPRRGSSQ